MHGMILDLAVALCVAALVRLLAQRTGQPATLGYVVAGILAGPYVQSIVPVDVHAVESLAELGVTLLMAGLGLEFSLRRLRKLGPVPMLVACAEVATMLWVGLSAAKLMGWQGSVAAVAAGSMAISSTMIVMRTLQGRTVEAGTRNLAMGILVSEDLLAILLLAGLNALRGSGSLDLSAVGADAIRLGVFIGAVLVGGILVVPRFVRAAAEVPGSEALLIASVGTFLGLAALASALGFSVAVGAFLAGALVGESGLSKRVEHLIKPLQELLVPVFFVAVGMQVDPAALWNNAVPILLMSALVVVGKVVGIAVAATAAGQGLPRALTVGMTLAQVGEFSFIIAAMGASMGAPFLLPVAVGTSLLTTILTPLLVAAAPSVAHQVDRRLPRGLQTALSLHASWIDRLTESLPIASAPSSGTTAKRSLGLLTLDGALMVALVYGAASVWELVVKDAAARMDVTLPVAGTVMIGGTLVLAVPFAVGMMSQARKLSRLLSARAYPPPQDGPDLAAAPRRVMEAALQAGVVLLGTVVVVATTQPVVPPFLGMPVLMGAAVVLARQVWRQAQGLEGHVRAGALVVAEVLMKQARAPAPDLSAPETLLPGLGKMECVRLVAGSHGAGRSLAELNLRGATGATVVALVRGNEAMPVPAANLPLQEDDALALMGSADSLAAARALLTAPSAAPGPAAGTSEPPGSSNAPATAEPSTAPPPAIEHP